MQIRNRARKRNLGIGAVLSAVSILLAGYALWPTSYRTETFSVSSDLLPQEYRLEVRFPRFGPSDETVAVDATLRPEGQTADFPPPGEANPVIVAQIQSAMISFSPAGEISTPLQEGIPVHFSWQALADSPGEGTFNFFLFRAGAEEVQGVYVHQPVWARVFPYDTFAGPGGLKLPFLFFAVFGGVFGSGLLIGNTLLANRGRPGLLAGKKNRTI